LTVFKLVLFFVLSFFHFFIKKECGMNHSPRTPSTDIGMYQSNDTKYCCYNDTAQHYRRLKI